jgi:hypothetical protein
LIQFSSPQEVNGPQQAACFSNQTYIQRACLIAYLRASLADEIRIRASGFGQRAAAKDSFMSP